MEALTSRQKFDVARMRSRALVSTVYRRVSACALARSLIPNGGRRRRRRRRRRRQVSLCASRRQPKMKAKKKRIHCVIQLALARAREHERLAVSNYARSYDSRPPLPSPTMTTTDCGNVARRRRRRRRHRSCRVCRLIYRSEHNLRARARACSLAVVVLRKETSFYTLFFPPFLLLLALFIKATASIDEDRHTDENDGRGSKGGGSS